MNQFKRIAVFCGSSPGRGDRYIAEAFNAGCIIAQQGYDIVYGGAQVGLMGAVADGALSINGEVTGIIPSFLKTKEIAHEGLTELIVVETMHERKMRMHELSDAIIALPGGYGTIEELFEMLTWAQLGLHSKPIGILNIGGFYNGLIQQIQVMVSEGFLNTTNADMLLVADSIESLLLQMANYIPPVVPKWIKDESKT